MAKKLRKWIVLGLLVVAVLLGYLWITSKTAPMPAGPDFYVRYDKPTPLRTILSDMQARGVIRDADALALLAELIRKPEKIQPGTYKVHAGLGAPALLDRFQKPIFLKVRIPETNWAARTARLLETKYEVCRADEYMALVHDPAQFAKDVSFPLPKTSLEGYLYPDTYELEPLMGARAVVLRQLKAFQDKIWDAYNHPKDLSRVLVVASMVELESGHDADRPKIAGVIENRIAQKMRLQIDATLLYGIQKWRRLTFADYKNLKTPYNTYTHAGLPPGPICSPDSKSVAAALNPDRNGKYVFYIAMPDGHTAFSATFAEHRHNIKLRDLEKKVLGR